MPSKVDITFTLIGLDKPIDANQPVELQLHWYVTPKPVDEGLPGSMLTALAECFCKLGKLTFISDGKQFINASWSKRLKSMLVADHTQWQVLPDHAFQEIHLPAIRSKPLALVETSSSRIASQAFLIQGWHYALCQAIFFMKKDAPHLSLANYEIEWLVLQKDWYPIHASLTASGILGWCTPAHDGAALTFVCFDKAMASLLLCELRRMAHAAGWAFNGANQQNLQARH